MNNIRTLTDRLAARPLKEQKKELLFSELHSLLSAGLDFSRAFRLLIDQESDRHVKQLLDRLYAQVVSGASLWQALDGSGRFPALDCGVVRIGEQTGRLNEALDFLAAYYRKRVAQRRMVSSAVSYNQSMPDMKSYPYLHLIPHGYLLSSGEEILTDGMRNPNTDAAMFGQLAKITYPTKGYSIFQYESHDARFVVTRGGSYECRPHLVNYSLYGGSTQVGGVRIKKIIDYHIQDTIADINKTNLIIMSTSTTPAIG